MFLSFLFTLFISSSLTLAIEEAEPGQFPYIVSLKLSTLGGHNCAGAVLSPWWVVSTGYCAQTDDDLDHDHFSIVAGEWDLGAQDGTEQVTYVDRVYTHPYLSAQQGADIALIRLNASLELNDFVQTISLAELGSSWTGSQCQESGWSQLGGKMKLQFAEPTVREREECAGNSNTGPMGYATMCAGDGVSGTAVMCPGYTGSPLVCSDDQGNDVLAGLQSFTYSCFTEGAPSVYADIGALRDWVDYILAKYEN